MPQWHQQVRLKTSVDVLRNTEAVDKVAFNYRSSQNISRDDRLAAAIHSIKCRAAATLDRNYHKGDRSILVVLRALLSEVTRSKDQEDLSKLQIL